MELSLKRFAYFVFVAVSVKLNLQSTVKYTTVSVRLILPKVGLTNLHGHNEKVLSEKKMIFNSY